MLVVTMIALLIGVSSCAGSSEASETEALEPTPPLTATSAEETKSVPVPTSAAGGETDGLSHFTNCLFRTGSNATVAVPVDTLIEGDITLQPGDEVAIFTSDGATCAGASVWSGQNIAISAWGDDSKTSEIDGLTDDEEMLFRLWLQSEGKEYTASEATFVIGDGLYSADGIHAVGSLKMVPH